MSTKVSITLDDAVLRFVDEAAVENRSRFINEVLRKEQRRILCEELKAAYIEQAADPYFQAEFADWDVTLGDGLANDA
jgi:metal-responsive CopG/Arc/MetJ family transcriptional regulator